VCLSSESLAFIAPSTALTPFQGLALEVFLSLTRHAAGYNCVFNTPDLVLFFRVPGSKPATEAACLSWDSSDVAPPPTHLSRVHSHSPRAASVCRCDTADLVPPTWFLTTSTACSAMRLQVCCALLPILGSAAFHLLSHRLEPKLGATEPVFPATQTPFEEFPSLTAVPCHHDRCPLDVTPALLRRGRSHVVSALSPTGRSRSPRWREERAEACPRGVKPNNPPSAGACFQASAFRGALGWEPPTRPCSVNESVV
jgi:hypothetical protein